MCYFSYQAGHEKGLELQNQEPNFIPTPTINRQENIYEEDTHEGIIRQELLGTSDRLWCIFLSSVEGERACYSDRAFWS